ncbi:MAG: dockerin type I domain-containing protein, partial [Candidatus Micrarchaeia archaeon]
MDVGYKGFFVLFSLFCATLLTGCVTSPTGDGAGTDVTALAFSLPQVKAFLAQYPNAKISVALWDSTTVEKNLATIRADCGEQFAAADYYKVTVTDQSLSLVVWLDKATQNVVCMVNGSASIQVPSAPTSVPVKSAESTVVPSVSSTAIPSENTPPMPPSMVVESTASTSSTNTASSTQVASGLFSPQTAVSTFSVGSKFASDNSVSLSSKIGSTPVTSVAISGDVVMNSSDSLVRVIFSDKTGNEYLVYEANRYLESRDSFSIDSKCDETCYFSPALAPGKLSIELVNATLSLRSVNYGTSTSKLALNSAFSKTSRDESKIASINSQIARQGKTWVAGETEFSRLNYSQKKKLFTYENGTQMAKLPNLQGFEYYTGGVFEVQSSSSVANILGQNSEVLETQSLTNNLPVLGDEQPKSAPCGKPGDVDGDGYITTLDYTLVKDLIRSSTLTSDNLARGDVDSSYYLNSTDLSLISSFLSGSITVFPACETLKLKRVSPCGLPGDVNADGYITSSDSLLVYDLMLSTSPTADQFAIADVDSNYILDYDDIWLIASYLKRSTDTFPACEPQPPLNPALPLSWDWRNVSGENWLTSVKTQDGGTCGYYTTLGAFETQLNLYYNQHLDLDLSEQMYVDCAADGNLPQGMGGQAYPECDWNGATTLCGNSQQFCISSLHGFVDETCDPHAERWGSNCNNAYYCSNWQSRTWTNSDYYGYIPYDDRGYCRKTTDSVTSDDLKKILIEAGPIASGLSSWRHSMTLVGYSIDPFDNRTIWIFKNSWGSVWGEQGYAKIKVSFGDIILGALPKGPFIPPSDKTYWPAGFDNSIKCTDKDGDGYCYWGITSEKPTTCSASCKPEKDCNDNNATFGPSFANFSCKIIGGLPSPTPTPSATPTPNPGLRVAPCGKPGDVNADGYVTTTDYELAYDLIDSSSLTADQLARVDVNANGRADYSDVGLISSYSNGNINTFPACNTSTPTPSPTPTLTPTPSVTPTPSPTPIVVNCTDLDNGLNYNQSSSVRITYSNGTSRTIYDFCYDSGIVFELYCSSTSSYASSGYVCPQGCSNGACVSATVTAIPTPSHTPSPSPAPSPAPSVTPTSTPIPGLRVAPCGKPGDIDADGYITRSDYELAYTLVDSGSLTADQLARVDVDANGYAGYNDVSLISSYSNGNINTFTACTASTPTPSGNYS